MSPFAGYGTINNNLSQGYSGKIDRSDARQAPVLLLLCLNLTINKDDLGTIISRGTILKYYPGSAPKLSPSLLNLVPYVYGTFVSAVGLPHAHEARRAGNAEHVFANGRPEGRGIPR